MRRPKLTIALKPRAVPAGAMKALAGATLPPASVPPTVAPPETDAGPLPAPTPPTAGATDGLGMGTGGLAVHPSLKAHNIGGREARHTSRTR
jgi:hypothetical protein